MRQIEHHDRLLTDMQSGDDAVIVAAAQDLLALGEYGEPRGTYLLSGGKAALRAKRLADAVVLLYHGLEVTQPNTAVWAETLVNRAVACSRHGFYPDAIAAGEQFLGALQAFPQFSAWTPYAHQALGYAHDRLGQYDRAAHHFGLAVDSFTAATDRSIAGCNQAFALANAGKVADAQERLNQIGPVDDAYAMFVVHGTAVMINCRQNRFADAVEAGDQAEGLAVGNEEAWDEPLAEVRYWLSRAVWEMGNRHLAARLALYAAVVADVRRIYRVRDAANEWLTTIIERGGVTHA